MARSHCPLTRGEAPASLALMDRLGWMVSTYGWVADRRSRAATLLFACAALPSCARPDDPAATGSGSGETSTADEGAETATAAEQGGTEESGDEGPMDMDACEAMADALSIAFALDTTEFPTGPEQNPQEGPEGSTYFDYEAACTVSAVEVGSGVVTTDLDCMIDDVPVSTSLSVAAPVAGTPAWSTGEQVALTTTAWLNGKSLDAGWGALHRMSDASLLVGGGSSLGFISPLTIDDVSPCAVVEACTGDPAAPLQGLIGEPGGEGVLLTGGQYSELPLADGTIMQVDPEWYHSDTSCHGYGPRIAVAFRRVML